MFQEGVFETETGAARPLLTQHRATEHYFHCILLVTSKPLCPAWIQSRGGLASTSLWEAGKVSLQNSKWDGRSWCTVETAPCHHSFLLSEPLGKKIKWEWWACLMWAADQPQKDLALEQPDGTTVIGHLVSIYVKATQSRPPHLTAPKPLLNAVSEGGPLSGRWIHSHGKSFKRLYGYKVTSQLGVHVISHLSKPSVDGMGSHTRHRVKDSFLDVTAAHLMRKRRRGHLLRSHMRDGSLDCELGALSS